MSKRCQSHGALRLNKFLRSKFLSVIAQLMFDILLQTYIAISNVIITFLRLETLKTYCFEKSQPCAMFSLLPLYATLIYSNKFYAWVCCATFSCDVTPTITSKNNETLLVLNIFFIRRSLYLYNSIFYDLFYKQCCLVWWEQHCFTGEEGEVNTKSQKFLH